MLLAHVRCNMYYISEENGYLSEKKTLYFGRWQSSSRLLRKCNNVSPEGTIETHRTYL